MAGNQFKRRPCATSCSSEPGGGVRAAAVRVDDAWLKRSRRRPWCSIAWITSVTRQAINRAVSIANLRSVVAIRMDGQLAVFDLRAPEAHYRRRHGRRLACNRQGSWAGGGGGAPCRPWRRSGYSAGRSWEASCTCLMAAAWNGGK